MVGLLIVLGLGALLYRVAKGASGPRRGIVALALAGYSVRLVFSLFQRNVAFFSHAAGGDYLAYETWARTIARLWSYDSLHYVGSVELPEMGRTTLPPNLFGLVFYLNGGDTQIGCTAVVACLACLACVNIYALALESRATEKVCVRVLATLLFLPSYLFYTSEMFKDGIVQFCVVGIGCSALRLSRRFSVKHLLFALACLAILYGTRFYLVYATMLPLGLGVLGLRSGSAFRLIASTVAVGIFVLAVVELSGISDAWVEDATTTFEEGTSQNVRDVGALGGSGVAVDTKSAVGFTEALFFTLFAPFFWQSGSLGFQLGKIDALVWYVVAYYAAKGAVRLAKTRLSELVILLSFIVPTTLAYAAAFANIGLTVRERLGVVMMCALLGAMGLFQRANQRPTRSLPGPVWQCLGRGTGDDVRGAPARRRGHEPQCQAGSRASASAKTSRSR